MSKEKKEKYEYLRVPVSPVERKKLMILAVKEDCKSISILLKSMALKAIERAEKEGLFNLSFLEQNQQK